MGDILQALSYDPIEGMAQLAMDESADRNLRFQAFKELAQYLYPKRKAIEIAAEDNSNSSVQVTGVLRVPMPLTEEEWLRASREHHKPLNGG